MEDWMERGMMLYRAFEGMTVDELERLLIESDSREMRALFRTMINLKLQLMQEKVTGEELV